jgi:hypothetical protein
MKLEHKQLVVRYLFGLIEGSSVGLEEALKDDFLIDFNLAPEKLEVIGVDKFINDGDGCDIWIGSMTVNLIIDGEEFSVSRDWEEEYHMNRKHPDYKTDADFYDSLKPHSHTRYLEIMKSLEG